MSLFPRATRTPRRCYHAEWRMVLGLITGGLGMSAQETDQLFGVFDADGSGSLDYGEFCQVLDALPLQRAIKESPLGYAVSALQSMLVLKSQLVSALSIEQLASAGRVISRLKGAGFSEDDARTVVQAVFLSRSRDALRHSWGGAEAGGKRRQGRRQGHRRRRGGQGQGGARRHAARRHAARRRA